LNLQKPLAQAGSKSHFGLTPEKLKKHAAAETL